MNTPAYIVVMVLLVLMSAYFSATETAFSSLSKTRLKTMVEKGNKKAKRTLQVAEKYDKLISTILIGNNIVNIALSSIATVFFIKQCGLENSGATVSTIVITLVVLVFGEITPKSVAKDIPEKFAIFATPALSVLLTVFTPLTVIFSGWKKLINKIIKAEDDGKMSQEELLMFVDEVQQDGSIEDDEGELLKNVIEFKDTNAEDILTHRTDLVAVPCDVSKEELAELFAETQFSRIMVYQDNIDNIIGVIHQKDLYTAKGLTNKKISELISPTIYIGSSMKINDLLKSLQKNKTHVAVVVDEYGGTLGIVTMEDILEELVGEIWDEHDEVVELIEKIGDDTYNVDCMIDMDDFCEYFNIEIDAQSVSFGGFILELFDEIPKINDSVDYLHGEINEETGEQLNFRITVTEMDYHRVAKAQVEVTRILNEAEE